MALAFDKQVDLVIDEFLSPEARRETFVMAARDLLRESLDLNRAGLGFEPEFEQVVDGSAGRALESVRIPNGVVVFRFAIQAAAVDFISESLQRLSPFASGDYQDSHVLLVNGSQVSPPVEIDVDDVISFTNLLPYARKIEQGLSSQAPDGVYEVVAAMARRRFRSFLDVKFSYVNYLGAGPGGPRSRQGGPRTQAGDDRFPTITVIRK